MSDQPSWPSSNDEGSQPPPPPSGGAPPPPPPPSSGSDAPPQYQQQDWGQPGYGAAPANQPTAATYGVRLGSKIIDWLILAIPSALVGALFLDLDNPASLVTATQGASFTAVGILLGLAQIAYFILMEANTGATLGKKVLNLRVYGTSGGNPTMEEAAKRNGWMFLGLVPILGGLAQLAAQIAIPITGSSDPYKRGWHDKFAGGTTVVKTA